VTTLPEPRPIAEYEGVDRARFLDEIRPAGRPAVLRGLGAGWPAVAAANASDEAAVDYLLGFRPVRDVAAIVGPPEIGGRFFYRDDMRALNFGRGRAPLGDVLGRLLRDRGGPAPHAMAVQSEVLPELLPGFAEANTIPLLPRASAPRIWIGNAIQVAPHYDLKENIGVVVAGRRRFTLFPPEQMANLYPGPLELTPAGTPVSMVQLAAPDLDRYPGFAEAMETAQAATLNPGDAIYIPFHWWHGVDSLDAFNIFVNYWWNEAPEGLGNPYDALMHCLFAIRHLPEEQRRVWRHVFDRYVFATEGDPVAHLPPHAKGVLGPDPDPALLARMRATLKQIASGL